MRLLARGIVLSLLGLASLALGLPTLAWTLIASGAVLAVADVAVGPVRRRAGYRVP